MLLIPKRSSKSYAMAVIKGKNNQACMVCAQPKTVSSHFGSLSCLACAAFFRRTVSLSIEFKCKDHGSCTIYYELRMICRSCRFNKCLEAGMRKQYVQKRRTCRKKQGCHKNLFRNVECEKSLTRKEIADNCNNCHFCCIPHFIFIFSVSAKIEGFNIEQIHSAECQSLNVKVSTCQNFADTPCSSYLYTDNQLLSTPTTHIKEDYDRTEPYLRPFSKVEIEPRLLNITGEELLQHQFEELKKTMDRRRVMFTDTPLKAVTEQCGAVPFTRNCMAKPHTLVRQLNSQRFDYLLAFEYCKTTPGFDQLNGDEKAIFFRLCAITFCLLDIGWLSSQITVPGEEYIVYTDGSVSSVRDLSIGWDDEDGLEMDGKSNSVKVKLFFEFISRFHDAIVRPLQENKVDAVEYAALKAFCVWKLGYFEYTNKMRKLAKEHETALLVGLDAYYEDREDKAERLGNIILLMGTIFEMYQLIFETYQAAELFNLFKIDAFSKVLLSL